MSENILEINNLSKYFGGLAAISNCSIKVKKGTITGIDNAAPFFTSWWKALRTDDEGIVDQTIDGKELEDSISVWMENSKINQNQANYLNYTFMFKPFQISNNEIFRFMGNSPGFWI